MDSCMDIIFTDTSSMDHLIFKWYILGYPSYPTAVAS